MIALVNHKIWHAMILNKTVLYFLKYIKLYTLYCIISYIYTYESKIWICSYLYKYKDIYIYASINMSIYIMIMTVANEEITMEKEQSKTGFRSWWTNLTIRRLDSGQLPVFLVTFGSVIGIGRPLRYKPHVGPSNFIACAARQNPWSGPRKLWNMSWKILPQ